MSKATGGSPMFQEGLQSPDLLQLAAGLTRSFSPEHSATLHHASDLTRVERSPRRSGDLSDFPYILASFTPTGDQRADLAGEHEGLHEACRQIFGTRRLTYTRWLEDGVSFLNRERHGRTDQITFYDAGRTVLFTRMPLGGAGEGATPAVLYAGRLELRLIGFALAVLQHPAGGQAGYASVSLVDVGGAYFNYRSSDNPRIRRERITVQTAINLSQGRPDHGIRPVIDKVYRAANLQGSYNYTDAGWNRWDEKFGSLAAE